MLLQFLSSGANNIIILLLIDNDLVRVMAIVATIENLILILNLIVVWQLCRIIHAYLTTAFARILQNIGSMARATRQIG
jgi:hypothetical protein